MVKDILCMQTAQFHMELWLRLTGELSFLIGEMIPLWLILHRSTGTRTGKRLVNF